MNVDEMTPPEDEQIIITKYGCVIMSLDTALKLINPKNEKLHYSFDEAVNKIIEYMGEEEE